MESGESRELKTLYIEEELSQHGEWLCDVLMEAIDRRKLKRTEELYNSISPAGYPVQWVATGVPYT